ncbi:MAG: HAD family phosphatase [Chitinophagia bacterium]|nr:HAD family phosphatase [Chitinophagia bacterium]
MDTIIWDLGGVLVDWSTTYVYDEHYFESLEKRDYFFEHICTSDWNENQDAGYPLARATEEKIKEHPQWETAIRDFYGRWEDMLRGPLVETVTIFEQLRARQQYRFYALTNWSAETFPIALKRFDFLHWFDGRLVSGEEGTRKPFPAFYQLLFDRYQVDPARAVFIDDNLRNVKAGEALGLKGIHFTSSSSLQEELVRLGLL